MQNYKQELTQQILNSKMEGIHAYLVELYSVLSEKLDAKGINLEVGSGAGISKIFLNSRQVKMTDFLESPSKDVMGGVDAQQLPFSNSSYSVAFGVDFLHHIPNPFEAIGELARVTNSSLWKGRIVLIEPYVSYLSYPIYKIFHKERTNFIRKNKNSRSLTSGNPADGNQLIPRYIFCSSQGKLKLDAVIPNSEWDVQITFLHPFSFFATGGLNNPLKTPARLIEAILKLESKIPKILMKAIGSRMLIEITKR